MMDMQRGLDRVHGLLARFQLPDQLVTDPITVALESAVYAVLQGGPDPQSVGLKTVEVLPRNATQFERGLAMGMALCLATEHARG